MKQWLLVFVAAAFWLMAEPLWAEDVVRVRGGHEESDTKARLDRLERAVDQLQRKVFHLENASAVAAPVGSAITCSVKTPFDGSFAATEPTEATARAKALAQCKEKTQNGIYCEERELKCGK